MATRDSVVGGDHRREQTMTSQTTAPIDQDRLMSFVFRAVDEVGDRISAALASRGLPATV